MTTTPFNSFIDSADIQDVPSTVPINDRFVTGFQFGYSSPNLNNPGATSSGLYSILNGIWLSQVYDFSWGDSVGAALEKSSLNFIFNANFYPIIDPDSNHLLWVIRSPQPLISNLNTLHQSINGYMALIDPSNSELTDAIINGSVSNAQSTLYTSIFNKFNSVNFINSYTGYNDVVLNGNYTGNGIAHLFVLSGQNDPDKWQLSRAGVELQCLIDYLCYGGVAVIGPTWKSLNNYWYTAKNFPGTIRQILRQQYPENVDELNTIGTRFFTPPLDAVVTLEQGGLIERRSSVAGFGTTGANRVAYASQPYSYPNVGVSYGIAYGLTGAELINNHNPPSEKGSFLTAFFGSQSNYNTIPVIHAGFSGTDVSIDQVPTPNTSIFSRYPGLNGLTGQRPESNDSSAGLTNYTFRDIDENSELNRLLCVIGKNTKTNFGQDFINPIGKQNLIIKIPAVADVAGILARNKTFGEGLYIPPAGPDRAPMRNGEIIPNFKFSRSFPDSVTLYTNRIAFFDIDSGIFGNNIPFLTNDLTGATSNTIDQDRDRLSINWMVRGIRSMIETYLNTLVNVAQSNSSLWNTVKSTIEGLITKNFGTRYLQSFSVTCDTTNGNRDNFPTLFVDVTITPKPTLVTYSGPTSQNLNGYVLKFVINTASTK